MLGFILGTMTGGVMGVFAMCLFIAGKREDEALERCRIKRKEIIDHGVKCYNKVVTEVANKI